MFYKIGFVSFSGSFHSILVQFLYLISGHINPLHHFGSFNFPSTNGYKYLSSTDVCCDNS